MLSSHRRFSEFSPLLPAPTVLPGSREFEIEMSYSDLSLSKKQLRDARVDVGQKLQCRI